jgi:hypothetical protein
MRRAFLSVALCVQASAAAQAAEVTRVASSFETARPFELYLDVGLERRQESGTIAREWYDASGPRDFKTLDYSRLDTLLAFNAHIGVFRGLEFHFGVPVVFQQDRTYSLLPSGTQTLSSECGDATGAGCAMPGNGTGALVDVPASGARSFHSGIGDLTFGFGWAVSRQSKDETRPNWTLRVDYTAPTASLNNPTVTTSARARGNIGERVHRLALSTALSRRFGLVEPTFEMGYVAPVLSASIYSNCDNVTSGQLGRAENCGVGPWTRDATGTQPSHTVGGALGVEFHVFERPERSQRVVLSGSGFANYFSASRSFNALSPLFGKLLRSSAFGQAGVRLQFLGQAGDFLQIRVSAAFSALSDRWLSSEEPGVDIDGNGQIDFESTASAGAQEVNPNFDQRIDRAGRRFRMLGNAAFDLNLTATFRF